MKFKKRLLLALFKLFCPSFKKETFSLHLVSNCQLVGVKIGHTVNIALDFGLDFGLALGLSLLMFFVFFACFSPLPDLAVKKLSLRCITVITVGLHTGSAKKSLGEWCTARNTYLSIHF